MKMSWLMLAFGLILLGSPHRIATAAENQIIFDQVISKWTVAPNGTWVVDAEVTIRAPKDNVTHVVVVPLTWSASTEKLEVVQARIDKPDGNSVVLRPEMIRED